MMAEVVISCPPHHHRMSSTVVVEFGHLSQRAQVVEEVCEVLHPDRHPLHPYRVEVVEIVVVMLAVARMLLFVAAFASVPQLAATAIAR